MNRDAIRASAERLVAQARRSRSARTRDQADTLALMLDAEAQAHRAADTYPDPQTLGHASCALTEVRSEARRLDGVLNWR